MTPTVLIEYTYEQESASATWVINHGQNRFPIVDVYVDVSGVSTKIIPLSVTYVSANTVEVAFSTARTGHAVLM